jgi:transposase-like protein
MSILFPGKCRLLREELRIKDARMASIPAHHRPFYRPKERLAILELKAARGWSLEQTAERFSVCAKTIASWLKRLDEEGTAALVQLPFRSTGSRTLCATLSNDSRPCALRWGRRSWPKSWPEPVCIWESRPSGVFVRRGHISSRKPKAVETKRRTVTANRPNHVWHVDLTMVPTQLGFWCPWSPFAWPQSWPWCWWVAFVLDHYSRRVMGFAKPELPQPMVGQNPTSVRIVAVCQASR